MKDWKEVKLGDISQTISYGYTESASSEEVGPKFLRITDIASTRLKWNKVPYCSITDSNFEKYKLYPGDIVIARTGATTGANYILKANDPKNVVYASYLIRYQIDNDLAYPFYVGHILQSITWKEFVKSIAGGSAQPGANAKELGSFEFLLPPLAEQKAIAEVLSSLDDKIDLLHRQNETLEEMAQTLFRQWFVEEAEDSWEEGNINDLAKLRSGKSLKRSFFIENGPYKVLGSNGEMGQTDRFLLDEKLLFTGRVGTLGNVFRIENEKVWLSDNTIAFTKVKYFNFLYFLLKNEDLKRFNVGSTQPLIRQSDVKEISFLTPPSDMISEFERLVQTFFDKINKNKIQIQTLEKLRDTLLPKLMSGEVRVKL